jgi:lauroyl-KDO2-lipid IV(A) myristoyltransferase
MSNAAAARAPFRAQLLAPRHWPSWLGVGLFSLLLLLPRSLRDGLAGRVGGLQYRLNRKRRGVVELNLAQCYPHLDETQRDRLARAHFRAYAQVMADQASLWWDWQRRFPARRCVVHGEEHVRALRERGTPIILLNAHTVAIDVGGIALTQYLPMVAIVRPIRDAVLDWVVARVRTRFGGRLYPREAGLRPVIRELRAGGCLYYSPDEDLGARDSVFVPFFGQPKATLATLGRMAEMMRARVVPVYTWYDASRGTYQVCLQPPLEDFPSGEPAADAARMNEALERSIALCPEQFLWNYRLFRTRPDGSRMPYPRHGGLRRAWRRRQRRRRKQRG